MKYLILTFALMAGFSAQAMTKAEPFSLVCVSDFVVSDNGKPTGHLAQRVTISSTTGEITTEKIIDDPGEIPHEHTITTASNYFSGYDGPEVAILTLGYLGHYWNINVTAFPVGSSLAFSVTHNDTGNRRRKALFKATMPFGETLTAQSYISVPGRENVSTSWSISCLTK